MATFSSKLFCRRTKNDAILLHLNRKSCGLDWHYRWGSAQICFLINVFEFLLVSPQIGKTSPESVSFITQQPLDIFACHFSDFYSFLYANYEYQVIFGVIMQILQRKALEVQESGQKQRENSRQNTAISS